MDILVATPPALTPLLEVALGFVLGASIVRAMPRIIPSRWLIGLGLAGIGVVAIVGVFVYPFHHRMLVLVAVLASYVVSGGALRTAEIRSRYCGDELILLALALLAAVTAGGLLGYSLLALVGGLGSPTILVLGFTGAVMLASAFALIVLLMDRGGGKSPVNWRATIEAARVLSDRQDVANRAG